MALQLFKIASTTVESSTASIEFTSIPSGYTDLIIKISGRSTSTTSNWTAVRIAFNGTSATTNWSGRELYATGSAAASWTYSSDQSAGGFITTTNATSNTFGNTEIYIPNYTSSNNKSISTDSVTENNATSATIALEASLWSNTASITSLSLTPQVGNFIDNSTATLYGVL